MLRIRWHGHSCFSISNNKTIIIDPHDGVSIGIPSPRIKADIILVTHDHFDHNQAKLVEKEGSIVLRSGKKFEEIEIESFSSYHDKEKGRKRGEITVFKIKYDEIIFCHLGDIGEIDEKLIKEIGDVDILFIPVGGTFTINAKEALEMSKKINPRVIVPMHYKIEGLSLPIDRLDKFLDLIEEIEVVYVANEVEITKEDLPENKEVWVFSL
ncbi:MAG: MBL fold metallo-hydrolase [Thermoplasmatales archaeon]|nr:MBL fold metallo-hydrolase [Thermoplasmatales archaeon]